MAMAMVSVHTNTYNEQTKKMNIKLKNMRAYLFYSTTEDEWEWCRATDIVIAESEDEARKLYTLSFSEKSLDSVVEVDLTVKGQTRINESVVE